VGGVDRLLNPCSTAPKAVALSRLGYGPAGVIEFYSHLKVWKNDLFKHIYNGVIWAITAKKIVP